MLAIVAVDVVVVSGVMRVFTSVLVAAVAVPVPVVAAVVVAVVVAVAAVAVVIRVLDSVLISWCARKLVLVVFVSGATLVQTT